MSVIANSVGLLRQSWRVLRADKELVVFPILSATAGLLVFASFMAPLAMLIPWEQVTQHPAKDVKTQLTVVHYTLMFGFYVVNFMVVSFFNSALAACVLERFRGGDPTVKFGLKAAVSRLHHIVGWAFLAATVGMVIKAIQERVGLVGKIVTGILGVAWTIASYFVIPVLVAENVGPIEALKRSGKLMSRTWGTSLASNIGLGLVGVLAVIVVALLATTGVILVLMGATSRSGSSSMDYALIIPGVLCVGGAILLGMAWGLINSALRSILNTALYHYAVNGAAPAGFDQATLQAAFKVKSK